MIVCIDFTALADSTDSDILKATDEYQSNATPTRKNNYTGLLKDYNLITICAESFCPWFISVELTPTLYKLSHTGILFENYYGTFQSVTTNGEYTMCMGLYPDMSRTKTDSSFNVAGTNYLPFCLGNARTVPVKTVREPSPTAVAATRYTWDEQLCLATLQKIRWPSSTTDGRTVIIWITHAGAAICTEYWITRKSWTIWPKDLIKKQQTTLSTMQHSKKNNTTSWRI